MTLVEAEDYMADEDDELAALVAHAERTDDFQERERLVDQVGALVKDQIARFVGGAA